jgi:hypothetical protein
MLNKETLDKLKSTFGSFIIDKVCGGDNTPFLRFGYWNRIDVDKLQSIVGDKITIEENDSEDDDCLPRFMYKMIGQYKG